MCGSDNFDDKDNSRDHFPWHSADKIRRELEGLATEKTRNPRIYRPDDRPFHKWRPSDRPSIDKPGKMLFE